MRLLRRWEFPERIVHAIEVQDFASRADAGSADALVQAMHFAAQVLPGGINLAAIDALAASAVKFPEHHPFAIAHQLTVQSVAEMLREAYRIFVSIRETLGR